MHKLFEEHKLQRTLCDCQAAECVCIDSMAVSYTDKYVTGGGPEAAEKARILLKLMQFIGAVSGGKTVTQVALNYLMCKGEQYHEAVNYNGIALMPESVQKL